MHRLLAPVVALLALAVASCNLSPWSRAEKEVAYRACRVNVELERVNVLQEDLFIFGNFMCACEVEELSSTLSHRTYSNPLHVAEVNGVLSAAKAECRQRWHRGERRVGW